MSAPSTTGRALAVAAALAAPLPAAAAQQRCGWFSNPTPANYELRDADGDWEIASRGGYQAPGIDALPNMTVKGWRSLNGTYGYGCACLSVEVDRKAMRVTRLIRAEPKPLAACDSDPKLRP